MCETLVPISSTALTTITKEKSTIHRCIICFWQHKFWKNLFPRQHVTKILQYGKDTRFFDVQFTLSNYRSYYVHTANSRKSKRKKVLSTMLFYSFLSRISGGNMKSTLFIKPNLITRFPIGNNQQSYRRLIFVPYTNLLSQGDALQKYVE